MDEREQQIVRTYKEFVDLGIIDDTENEEVDPESAKSVLANRIDDFENDINIAYEKDKSQTTSKLTQHAFLNLMIEGGTDDELREFIAQNGLSLRAPIEVRREDAIKLIQTVHQKAEKAIQLSERTNELWIKDEDYKSLDDTLVNILNRGGLSEADQGSMRLLFGLVVIDDPKISSNLVTQLKANAAGILRHKLAAADKASRFEQSLRAKEGEVLLYRMITQVRTGYPTVQSMAETIELDKESRAKASYSGNVERNKMMIETFISSALDVMYPEAQ